jgi:hypothetical protein
MCSAEVSFLYFTFPVFTDEKLYICTQVYQMSDKFLVAIFSLTHYTVDGSTSLKQIQSEV